MSKTNSKNVFFIVKFGLTNYRYNTPNLSEIQDWLKRIPCPADFEVEMRAGRVAGVAHCADDFALRDRVANIYIGRAEVSIQSLCAVVVFDNNVRTIATIPTGVARNDDLPVGRCHDRLADLMVGRGEVDGVVAVNALRFDAVCHRALVVALNGRIIFAGSAERNRTTACGDAGVATDVAD